MTQELRAAPHPLSQDRSSAYTSKGSQPPVTRAPEHSILCSGFPPIYMCVDTLTDTHIHEQNKSSKNCVPFFPDLVLIGNKTSFPSVTHRGHGHIQITYDLLYSSSAEGSVKEVVDEVLMGLRVDRPLWGTPMLKLYFPVPLSIF